MMNNYNPLVEDLAWTLKNFKQKFEDFENLSKEKLWEIENTSADPYWQAAQAVYILNKIGYGDCYYVDDFIERVEEGCFIEYDGIGSFVDDEGNKLSRIICDVKWLKENKPENCHFIMWYNK